MTNEQYESVPNLSKMMREGTSRNVSFNIVLQNIMQLKHNYKDWQDILSECDSILFFEAFNEETRTLVPNLVKKWTLSIETPPLIKKYDLDRKISETKGEGCLLFTRGKEPFFSKKIKIDENSGRAIY